MAMKKTNSNKKRNIFVAIAIILVLSLGVIYFSSIQSSYPNEIQNDLTYLQEDQHFLSETGMGLFFYSELGNEAYPTIDGTFNINTNEDIFTFAVGGDFNTNPFHDIYDSMFYVDYYIKKTNGDLLLLKNVFVYPTAQINGHTDVKTITNTGEAYQLIDTYIKEGYEELKYYKCVDEFLAVNIPHPESDELIFDAGREIFYGIEDEMVYGYICGNIYDGMMEASNGYDEILGQYYNNAFLFSDKLSFPTNAGYDDNGVVTIVADYWISDSFDVMKNDILKVEYFGAEVEETYIVYTLETPYEFGSYCDEHQVPLEVYEDFEIEIANGNEILFVDSNLCQVKADELNTQYIVYIMETPYEFGSYCNEHQVNLEIYEDFIIDIANGNDGFFVDGNLCQIKADELNTPYIVYTLETPYEFGSYCQEVEVNLADYENFLVQIANGNEVLFVDSNLCQIKADELNILLDTYWVNGGCALEQYSLQDYEFFIQHYEIYLDQAECQNILDTYPIKFIKKQYCMKVQASQEELNEYLGTYLMFDTLNECLNDNTNVEELFGLESYGVFANGMCYDRLNDMKQMFIDIGYDVYEDYNTCMIENALTEDMFYYSITYSRYYCSPTGYNDGMTLEELTILDEADELKTFYMTKSECEAGLQVAINLESGEVTQPVISSAGGSGWKPLSPKQVDAIVSENKIGVSWFEQFMNWIKNIFN